MELRLIDSHGNEAGLFCASRSLFGCDYNESLVHQVIVTYQANARSGNRAQKNREKVHHTTAKPFRQKGTGRARAGMSSSPLWRGGGRAFPNSTGENFTKKMNRRMYRAGIASIFSQLVREGRLSVVEELHVDSPKTGSFSKKIKGLGYGSVLVVTESLDENLFLASRNLPDVLVLSADEIDPLSLIRFPRVLLTKSALVRLEEILG